MSELSAWAFQDYRHEGSAPARVWKVESYRKAVIYRFEYPDGTILHRAPHWMQEAGGTLEEARAAVDAFRAAEAAKPFTDQELRRRGWISYAEIAHGYPVEKVTQAILDEVCGPGHRMVEHEGTWYVEGPNRHRLDNLLWAMKQTATKEAIADGEMLIPMPTDWVRVRELAGERRVTMERMLHELGDAVKYNYNWGHFVSPETAARVRGGGAEPEPVTVRDKVLAVMRQILAGEVEVRMTRRGLPYVRAIERLAGVDIDSRTRTALWREAKSGE